MICVLIVEDDENQALLVQMALSGCHDKYSVVTATSGEACLAMDLSVIDIVLLDYNLPDMSGIVLLQAILKKKALPIIMVTGENSWQVIKEAIQHGASDYIVKTRDYLETIPLAIDKNIETHKLKQERERMEESLRLSYLELEKTYADLKNIQSQLLQSEKMASIGQLAAGVAHEINNPIGFISSNLGTLHEYVTDIKRLLEKFSETIDILRMEPTDLARLRANHQDIEALRQQMDLDFIMEDLEKIILESKEGTGRVKAIVQNLKEFSHVGEAELKYADVNRGLKSTLSIVWNELKYKAQVVQEYGDIPEIWCYAQQLNQVFMNLLVNAAQAIPERGIITIKTYQEDNQVVVEISDTGSGIRPEHLSRIFEPFFTTKEVGKGTGLGLSISYGIVQKHGGRIEVESRVNEGTTFRIVLPIKNVEAPVAVA